MNIRAKAVVATTVTIPVLFVAGVAGAAWTANGTGSGGAKAKSSQAVTVTAGAPSSAQLYPGGSGDLVLTVANPNPYPVSVTEVDAPSASNLSASITDGTNAVSGCVTASDAGLSGSWTTGVKSLSSSPVTVAANGGTYTFTLTNALNMSNSSAAACGTSTGLVISVSGFSVKAASTNGAASSPSSQSFVMP